MKLFPSILILTSLFSAGCGEIFKPNDEDKRKQPPQFRGWDTQMPAPSQIEGENFTLAKEVCDSLKDKESRMRAATSDSLSAVFELRDMGCSGGKTNREATSTFKNLGEWDFEFKSNSRSNQIYFEKVVGANDSRLKPFCDVILNEAGQSPAPTSVSNTRTIGNNRSQISFYEAGNKYWIQLTEFSTRADSKFYPYLVDRMQVFTGYDSPDANVRGFIKERAENRPCNTGVTQYKVQVFNSLKTVEPPKP